MPALIQICVVIVTIALVTIAVMTSRMMTRFKKSTEELTQLSHAIHDSAAKFDLLTHEARALFASIRDVVPPVLHAVGRIDDVSERAAHLSSAILDELELPVRAAVAVARGLRSGAKHLLKRVVNRFTQNDSQINGGYDHE